MVVSLISSIATIQSSISGSTAWHWLALVSGEVGSTYSVLNDRAGSSTMVWMAKEQEKNPYGMPESTVGYHFMAFFVAGQFTKYLSNSCLVDYALSWPLFRLDITRRLCEIQVPSSACKAIEACSRCCGNTQNFTIFPNCGANTRGSGRCSSHHRQVHEDSAIARSLWGHLRLRHPHRASVP
jgi:hypothetical protein